MLPNPAFNSVRFAFWPLRDKAAQRRLDLRLAASTVSFLRDPLRTSMNYTEAFAHYGAKLNNPQWSVSAFAPDGSLVVCLWENYLKRGPERGTLEYKDTLSKWLGNVSGCNEIRNHLHMVQAGGLSIRLVIAHPSSAAEENLVGKVTDESSIKKTFSVKKEVVGTLTEFDGNIICIVFRKAA